MTQTAADGYPPGAPPPARNEAWRQAVANDGPEWPDGDRIGLELWASVNGRRYVFVIPPFALRLPPPAPGRPPFMGEVIETSRT